MNPHSHQEHHSYNNNKKLHTCTWLGYGINWIAQIPRAKRLCFLLLFCIVVIYRSHRPFNTTNCSHLCYAPHNSNRMRIIYRHIPEESICEFITIRVNTAVARVRFFCVAQSETLEFSAPTHINMLLEHKVRRAAT